MRGIKGVYGIVGFRETVAFGQRDLADDDVVTVREEVESGGRVWR